MTGTSGYNKNEIKRSPFFLLVTGIFFLYLIYRVLLMFYPNPNAGGVEINIIYFIQRLIDGQSFYTDPELTPYAIAQYSPLYYYITAGVAKIFGINADDLLKIYFINRGVSLLLNLAYISVVFIILKKVFSVSSRYSFYVAVFAFIFLEITSYCRPDSLNHVFFMLSLYYFLLGIKSSEERKEENRFILLAAAIAGVALFCKQTSFILPVIFGSWLLSQKKFKKIFLLAIVYGATVTCILLLIYFTTGDLILFYKNAIVGINNGIGLNWFRTVILPDYYYGFGLLFLLAAIGIFFFLRKEKSPLLRFSFFLLLALFGLLNFVALKFGSNPGYFTEWWTVLFFLLAYYWPVIKQNAAVADVRIPNTIIASCLLVKIVLLARPFNEMFINKPYTKALEQYNAEKRFAEKILEKMPSQDELSVFCNYYTADYYMSSLLFRNAVVPQMDIVILASYREKEYDYSDLEKSLTNGSIKWMLMRTTGLQKKFFNINLDKFQLVDTEAGFNLYEFKP